MRAPLCDPTATISVPSLATWPRLWLMPRPLSAAVKSSPARVAGGNPRAVAGATGLVFPLFASTMTTTATPKTIMARIGTAALVTQPWKCSSDRNCLDQVRLAGWGSNERSSLVHSAPAAPGSLGSLRSLGSLGPLGPPGSRGSRGRVPGVPGVAGVELEAGHSGLAVIGPRPRRPGRRLAHRRGVLEAPRPDARLAAPRLRPHARPAFRSGRASGRASGRTRLARANRPVLPDWRTAFPD